MGPKEVGKKNHAQGYLLNRKIWKWLLTHKFLKLVTAENYKVYLRALTPYIHFFFHFAMHTRCWQLFRTGYWFTCGLTHFSVTSS